jgi:predicted DNA-binding transcriptional regulator YafY
MGVHRIVVDKSYQMPLEHLAYQLGYSWGDRGNLRAMVEAIASGRLAVEGATAFSESQRYALGSAVISAVDRGEWQDALSLCAVFHLFPDERQKAQVAARMEPLERPWVWQVFNLIDKEQSFKLAYQDAAGRTFQFSVCSAQFVAHEHRTYLDCWCAETEGNQDIEALKHNWCLRLDRITDASILPFERKWRSLDAIRIEMEFCGGLAHAYEKRLEDTEIEWIEGDIKRVQRSITSSFWYIREILRYGKDCKVLSPPELVERVAHQFSEASKLYESSP